MTSANGVTMSPDSSALALDDEEDGSRAEEIGLIEHAVAREQIHAANGHRLTAGRQHRRVVIRYGGDLQGWVARRNAGEIGGAVRESGNGRRVEDRLLNDRHRNGNRDRGDRNDGSEWNAKGHHGSDARSDHTDPAAERPAHAHGAAAE